MRKKYGLLAVYGVAMVAVMCLIFYFSHQPAVVSSQESGTITRWIMRVFGKVLPEGLLEVVVRKAAHISVYFLLGICSILFFVQLGGCVRKKWMERFPWIGSIAWCFLYACSDELHQTFVQGRSGELRDVAIDGIGFVTAAMVVTWIRFIQGKKIK